MRAVIVREFGPVEVAELGEFPTPEPAPNEIVLEVHATAANFVDLLVIGGQYQFLPDLPFLPGKLPAVVVAEVGSAVTEPRRATACSPWRSRAATASSSPRSPGAAASW